MTPPQKKTVYKYPLVVNDVVNDELVVKMPKGAEILYINAQYDTPCIWARVNPTLPSELRRFRLAGTGDPLNGNVGKHIGSFFMRGGALVFHVFEIER